MLYACSGSQGTGKSTLLAALPYATIERKTSRSILSDWGVTLSEVNNNRELMIRFQDEILTRKMDDERQAALSNDVYITERTFADLFTYAMVVVGKDNEYSDWLDNYYHRCVDAQRSYACVWYLTGGHFQPVNDGVRAINRHYSRMVDLVMYDVTKSMTDADRLMVIDTPDLSKRVELIKASL